MLRSKRNVVAERGVFHDKETLVPLALAVNVGASGAVVSMVMTLEVAGSESFPVSSVANRL